MCTRAPDSIANGYVLQNSPGLLASGGQWVDDVVVDYKCFPHYALADGHQLTCNAAANTWDPSTGYGTPRCKYSLATEGNYRYYSFTIMLLPHCHWISAIPFFCFKERKGLVLGKKWLGPNPLRAISL